MIRMIRISISAFVLLASLAGRADAAPGLDSKVYGATVEAGVTELESRYGRLTGGAQDGEDALVLELSHGFSDHFYGAVLAGLERQPGGKRELATLAIEGIAPIGRIEALQLDVALYGEYEAVRGGADNLETKLLLQHRRGPFDARLNLIAKKPLAAGAPLEFGYAASVDWQAVGEFRLGAAAFGDLGSTRGFLPHAEHFLGPVVKTEIEHLPGDSDLEIEAGYLFALNPAQSAAKGQARLMLEWEAHF
jgi:hypothetical protein